MKLSNSQKTVLTYLRNCGPATARQITAATVLPYATVTHALRRLAFGSLVTVNSHTWTANVPAAEPSPEAPAATAPAAPASTPATPTPEPEPAPAEPDSAQPGTPAPAARRPYRRSERPRLAKGELQAMVLRYLRQHPEQEFGPTGVAKALDRADGAVINALNKLAADGLAIRTQDTPARFRAT
ncbi:hypothetical protein AB0B31_11010 [Catellatospora citrea]|uniref:hypothetical protein n=1 Tax=Catellatospora citrea TaxID=53366 RepID=UPI0033CEA8A7